MSNVDFATVVKDLPLIITTAMRVLNSDEQKQLADDVLKLVSDDSRTENAKNMALGLILIKLTGPKLLSVSVKYLEKIYKTKTKPLLDQISEIKI